MLPLKYVQSVNYWRSHCNKIVMFLDYGWSTNSNRQLCSADAFFVKKIVLWRQVLWFILKNQYWSLYKSLNGYGFFWDSELFSLYITDRRIEDFIIENRLSWDSAVCLKSNDFCITKLNFWRLNIELLNVKKFSSYIWTDTLIFSNASDIACSSYWLS